MYNLESCHKFLSIATALVLLCSQQSQLLWAQSGVSAGAPANSGVQSGSDLYTNAGSSNNGIGGGSFQGNSSSIGSLPSSADVSSNSLGSGFPGQMASGLPSIHGGAQAPANGSANTPKPEGLLTKMKEMVKSSVGLRDEKNYANMQPTGGPSLGSGDPQVSAAIDGQKKDEGLIDKLNDTKQGIKDKFAESARDIKENVKYMLKSNDTNQNNSYSNGSNGNLKLFNATVGVQVGRGGDGTKGEGTFSKLVNKTEEKSAVGKNGDEKSFTLDLVDKVFEVSKMPLEAALKPIDRALGVHKDPLIQAYDSSHEFLRKPLGAITRPFDQVLSGAFKTTDEAKADQERFLSDEERRDMKSHDERSVFGQISDRTIELAQKPIEIILKPVDRVMGFDKEGKKNPIVQLINSIYGFSKKPVDKVARPIERILRKMADGDQAYQVSIRLNSGESNDPKLFTRLADGALNIADRVVTKPIELAMRPLGYSTTKKNPIVDAAHSLKNATKVGVELFTRPIDRVIKEIADIGSLKGENEQQAEIERRKQDASRTVMVMDKIHEFMQSPWEIVLRPVSRALGYSEEGHREPLLRAWDVFHQVIRTPVQVFTKPLEDAVLGEKHHQQESSAKAEVKIGSRSLLQGSMAQIGASNGTSATAAASVVGNDDYRKNIFVDGIKKVERFASKPLEKITSPFRKLVLGEESKVLPDNTAPVRYGVSAQAQVISGNGKPDKIVKTIQHMNNVVLRPLEVMTQPISDMLSAEERQKRARSKISTNAASASASFRSSLIQDRMMNSTSASLLKVPFNQTLSVPNQPNRL